MSPSPASSRALSPASRGEDDSESGSSASESHASSRSVEDGDGNSRSNDSDAESESSDDGESAEDEEPVRVTSNMNKRKRKHDETEDKSTVIKGEDATRDAEDIRVFSHAEKRRQRREEQKKLKAQAQPESASKKRKKLRDNDAPTGTTKRQNSVWVGNLSYKTTVDDLKMFFAGAGEVTRINMPMTKPPAGPRQTPENRGFAYVDFSTPEAKTSAIAMSEQPLIGRKLLIKDGGDFSGRPQSVGDAGSLTASKPGGEGGATTKTYSKTAQKILKAQKQPPGPTLFIGNLGFETTEADILEMLTAHRNSPGAGKHHPTNSKGSDDGVEAGGKAKGKDKTKEAPTSSNSWIRKVRMGTFEDSNLCKGFAFVDFVSIEEATSALISPKNYLLNGRKLVIEYASPDAVRRGAPKGMGKLPVNKGGKLGKRVKFSQEAKVEAEVDEEGAEEDTAMEDRSSGQRASKRQRTGKPDKPAQKSGQKRGLRSRVKPGAALASAQRGSAAIIPSQGRKITFS